MSQSSVKFNEDELVFFLSHDFWFNLHIYCHLCTSPLLLLVLDMKYIVLLLLFQGYTRVQEHQGL